MATLHADLIESLCRWASSPFPRTYNASFLYGPPGIGKTTLARVALEKANHRVVEWNASQHRHKSAVEESLVPLLHSCNVADFFSASGPKPLGIILDEIDGMSVGDKGGLVELLRILKDYKGTNAIVCISNEWMEKKFQPFLKLCQTFAVAAPTVTDVEALLQTRIGSTQSCKDLATDLLRMHHGDLRKILQSVGEHRPGTSTNVVHEVSDALSSNRIRRSETIRTAVGQLLRGSMDMSADVPLNNNDLNLAGLHLHETLPTWLRRYIGNTERGYQMYKRTFSAILASDRLDYYTFFYQHWTLFPLTYQAKLQSVNQLLFGPDGVGDEVATDWTDDSMEYTAVLAKQSMLYNQFRYLCEMRDAYQQADPEFDGGFDSTVWKTNLFLSAASSALDGAGTKQTGHAIWEHTEFWRAQLPTWFPSVDPGRFMRLLQSLEVPHPIPFTTAP